MMRVLAIIGALLVGLVGLFMSVCGGGFFFSFLVSAVVGFVRQGNFAANIGMFPVILLAGGCCAVGVLLVFGCVRSIKKWWP